MIETKVENEVVRLCQRFVQNNNIRITQLATYLKYCNFAIEINNRNNMKELKCPKCGNVFQVDEADYASIVSQVRGKEFEAELKQRTESLKREMEADQKAAEAKAELKKQNELNTKDQTINERDAEIERLKQSLDTIKQTKDAEKEKALAEQTREMEKLRAEIQQEKNNMRVAVLEAENEAQKELRKQIDSAREELQKQKDRSREELQKQKDSSREELQAQKDLVKELEKAAALKDSEFELQVKSIREQHQKELTMKDEVIAQYKDFKTSLSTKMIGESLEVYCSNQFELHVRPYMPNVYFGKDNDVVDSTKGDFVYRDIVEGVESVSIMFEMKNEAEGTTEKQRNAKFFDKLDGDRKKKKCEYAVLVSMLELDNELYNNGIYTVPNHEKMFVIRPQQFLSIIALLTQMGRNTIKIKQELEIAKNKEVDVTKFEEKIGKFKSTFSKHVNDAANRYNGALKDIDKAIEQLTSMRENLRLWVEHLYKAENNFNDLEIKKLTSGNPTMRAKFEEARQLNVQEGDVEYLADNN